MLICFNHGINYTAIINFYRKGPKIMDEIQSGENRFFIGDDPKKPIAEITFRLVGNDNILVIDHTYVAEELRGEGIARKLIDKVVEYARAENKKIVPLCPYAKKLMIGNPEFDDILK